MVGLGGHMAHLSEDLDLTFNEIVDVLGKVASAEIKTATEKVDGQNLFLSVDYDGNILTARNATDIKKGCERDIMLVDNRLRVIEKKMWTIAGSIAIISFVVSPIGQRVVGTILTSDTPTSIIEETR